MKYIKSPINYVGNKYRLVEQIINLFPKNIDTFFDVFAGSGTVLINTMANKYIYNDVNQYITDIFKGLVTNDYETIVDNIDVIISNYSLSKTNKEGFEKLRDDYNNGKNDWITLYTLMCHSFNHQFRFNNQHQYNSSFGKNRSYFSERQRKDLLEMKYILNNKEIVISNKSFMDIDFSYFTKDDMIYFDPPYYNSVGNYNDGKRGFEGWSYQHEHSLLQLLDKLNERNIRFALSNNLKYDNELLLRWKDKYNVYHLNGDYINCNYHKLDRSKDYEVLITNY